MRLVMLSLSKHYASAFDKLRLTDKLSKRELKLSKFAFIPLVMLSLSKDYAPAFDKLRLTDKPS